MTDDDDLWVDSADRKVALKALSEHRDEANLTETEHQHRTELVRTAKNRADLHALFADLPPPHPQLDDPRDDDRTKVPFVHQGDPRFQHYRQAPTETAPNDPAATHPPRRTRAKVPFVWGGAPRFSRYQQAPTKTDLAVVLGSGGVIVVGALVAQWWLPAVLLAVLVGVVALFTARR